MVSKSVLGFCVQALLVQCITAYLYEPYVERSYEAYAYPAFINSPATLAASKGGLFVSSSSPIAPSGVTMISENAIEGPLTVGGQMPFLGAIAVEGTLPTAGAGGVAYGFGSGNAAILSEDLVGYRRPSATYSLYY